METKPKADKELTLTERLGKAKWYLQLALDKRLYTDRAGEDDIMVLQIRNAMVDLDRIIKESEKPRR